ncbi:hypothetical protein [Flavobacterium sp.]|uniref:hypothetical protein n=1 Tax=Flavobacterium sp. TaxID=239 RepID=UPI002B4AF3E2|nr:hypothetical protein [Flavobacterium sp.]HLF52553.1 hypothetical protein [Flavobacterium sp.]
MTEKKIETVKELIEFLKQYAEDTKLSHLTGSKNTSKETHDLYIIETNPIGDRDSEDIITLSFSNNPHPFN